MIYVGIIFILCVLFTYWKPHYILTIFIFCLPFLGQHPHYPYNRYYFGILSGILIGIIFIKRNVVHSASQYILLSFTFLFLCACSLLPYFYQIFQTLNFYEDSSRWLERVIDSSGENPLISLRNLGFFLFIILLSTLIIKKGIAQDLNNTLPLCLCLSSSFYSLIGLLGFFHLLDLGKMFPLAFPAEHRLQSIFWHPAWFAEYTVLSLPFFLIFLKRRQPRSSFFLYFALLWLNIISIALTFQRGGIVALGAVLVLWALFELKNKKKLFIPVVSTGIAFVIILIIFVCIIEPQQFKERYFDKLFENNRTRYWSVAEEMWLKAPLMGLGLDSYGWRYTDFRPKGSPGYVYLHGTAHNQYFQFFAGIGLVGLLCYIFIYFYLLRDAYNAYKDSHATKDLSLIIIYILFGIYALYQEIFYTLCIGTLFWLISTCIAGNIGARPANSYATRHFKISLVIILAAVFIVQLLYAFKEYKVLTQAQMHNGFGLYPKESFDKNHPTGCWSARKAWIPIDSTTRFLNIFAMHPDINQKPVIATLSYHGKLFCQLTWHAPGWKTIDLQLLTCNLQASDALFLKVNRIWIPKEYGSSDNRTLGVAINVSH